MTLHDFFQDHPKAALGFSGGVDSAYLLAAALDAGAEIRPYFIKTPFQPEFELADAKRLTAELGVSLTVISYDVLEIPQVAENPANRCYFCKKALFAQVQEQAKRDGFDLVLDGTNASDDAGDRPGMAAIREKGVLSPLRLCGLTKEEIRRRSRQRGLFTWNKPAYACLATRIPTDTAIDRETLKKVEKSEDALFALGYSDLRVRIFHGCARVQLPESQFPAAPEAYEAIRQALSPYFASILLDLKGR